jgi:hypothetical protein
MSYYPGVSIPTRGLAETKQCGAFASAMADSLPLRPDTKVRTAHRDNFGERTKAEGQASLELRDSAGLARSSR